MSRYALTGGGRRFPVGVGSGPALYNAATTPTDDVGNDGEFIINKADWSLWGPKGATVVGSWAGTRTSLKNFKTTENFWNFQGPTKDGSTAAFPTANLGKPGDLYFMGPSATEQAAGTGTIGIWINNGVIAGTSPRAVNNWYQVYYVSVGAGNVSGGDSSGGAGGGDGGDD